jgi:hypothetical protein
MIPAYRAIPMWSSSMSSGANGSGARAISMKSRTPSRLHNAR